MRAGEFLLANAGSPAGLQAMRARQAREDAAQAAAAAAAVARGRKNPVIDTPRPASDPASILRRALPRGMMPGSPDYDRYIRDPARVPAAPVEGQTADAPVMIAEPPSGGRGADPQRLPVAPVPGSITDGFVFLGGDPRRPESWRKL